jgi:Zn-dependent protease/CBS domain-containing protein
MSWSWRIGRIAGIDVFVHFTFVLLVAWLTYAHYAEHGDVGEALVGLAFILSLFGIIVLHELGHALAARHYGIDTRDITLLPIGGVARLDRIPEQPQQELVVALAGPAVNVVLALALYVGLRLDARLLQVSEAARVGGNFLVQLFWVNVFLAVFNMLPAFPMDGGRVLRAALAMRLDYVRATQIAVTVGQGMAVFFAVIGIYYNPFLMLIALFVWIGAEQEESLVKLKSSLAGIPVQRVMTTRFQQLRPEELVARAAEHVLAGFQQDFPVVDATGRVVGVLARRELASALAANNHSAPVGELMQTEFVTAHPRDMLYTVFTRLQECRCHTLPVVDDRGQLVGMVTADAVAEVVMMQEAGGDAVAAARERLDTEV